MTYKEQIEIKNRYEELLGQGWISSPDVVADWRLYLNDIEWLVWEDIRFWGVRLYPQFPVGKRFVDFGNPYVKVALEVDGKEWHGNMVAEGARDLELGALGWTVYHMPAQYVYREREECTCSGDDRESGFLCDYCEGTQDWNSLMRESEILLSEIRNEIHRRSGRVRLDAPVHITSVQLAI